MSGNAKSAIIQATIQLCAKKRIDGITVKDIVDAAKVTRQTFYYHFRDVIDLMNCIFERLTQETIQACLATPETEETVRVFFDLVLSHRQLMVKILHSELHTAAEHTMVNCLKEYYQAIIQRKKLFETQPRATVDTAVQFYAYATLGILMEADPDDPAAVESLVHTVMLLLTGKMPL